MDGRPNRRNKAAFSDLSKVVWTLPEILYFFSFLFVDVVFVVSFITIHQYLDSFLFKS